MAADDQLVPPVTAKCARTERVIWLDANGKQTDNPDEAVRGEIEVTHPDGSRENTL